MAIIDPTDSKYDAPSAGLPAGQHLVFVSDIFAGQSKAKGTPFVECVFECHDPASPYNGTSLRFQRFFITANATWRFVNLIKAARPEGCQPVDTEKDEALADALLDRALNIEVVVNKEVYEGVERTKAEVARFAPVTAAQASKLREAYNGELVPPMEGGTLGSSSADADSFTDDEIPF